MATLREHLTPGEVEALVEAAKANLNSGPTGLVIVSRSMRSIVVTIPGTGTIPPPARPGRRRVWTTAFLVRGCRTQALASPFDLSGLRKYTAAARFLHNLLRDQASRPRLARPKPSGEACTLRAKAVRRIIRHRRSCGASP